MRPAENFHASAPMDDHPRASRTSGRPTVELRQDIDRGVCDVLDAVAQARRITRSEVVADILAKWAHGKQMEATLIQRVTRGNPPLAAPDGMTGE